MSAVARLREDHGVVIDVFTKQPRPAMTFILTHMHSDHMSISQRFSHPIYTLIPLRILQPLYPAVLFIQCVENQRYGTRDGSTYFSLFRTQHTAYSCGILFPRVLYLGDGRMDRTLLETLRGTTLTIVYDPIFEEYPFLETVSPCRLLASALAQVPVLKCVHHGILYFLSLCSSLVFRPDASLPPLTRIVLEDLGLLDEHSPYTLVGRSFSGPHVVASAMWHVIHELDPRCIFKAKGAYRVFLSCHAGPGQIKEWKTQLPGCTFERLRIENAGNMRKVPRAVETTVFHCFRGVDSALEST
jgi:hypothetical protein